MPPEGEPRPTAEEIALLSRWIDAGSPGPQGEEKRVVALPRLAPVQGKKPITAVAVSPDGKRLAVARYDAVELFKQTPGADPTTQKKIHRLEGHAGKINDLRFTPNSKKLLAAGGVSGRNGEIVLWDVATGKKLKTFFGHSDTVYVAIVSGNEKYLPVEATIIKSYSGILKQVRSCIRFLDTMDRSSILHLALMQLI